MNNLIRRNTEILVVIILALSGSIISSANLFSRFLQAPPNTIFVGMTHYYADFFYYLDQFYQGAHGKLLIENNFTAESFKPLLVYFNNVLLGKIGGLMGMESFTSYNLSLVPLKLIYFILCYKFITLAYIKRFRDRICAFLLFLFSTSLPLILSGPEGEMSIFPIVVFRAKNTFFTRFANVPSQYLENIYFILLLIIGYYFATFVQKKITSDFNRRSLLTVYIKYILPSIILTLPLTISDPIKTLVYIVIFSSALWFIKPRIINRNFVLAAVVPFVLILTSFAIPALYLNKLINADPIFFNAVKWDYSEYVKQFKIIDFFGIIKSFGLLGIFSLLGLLISIFKKNSLIQKMIIIGLVTSIAGYILPYFINISYIPGFRFMMTSSFLFMAIVSINFLTLIEKILNKYFYLLIVCIYLLINSLTIFNTFKSEVKPLQEPEFHFAYLSSEIYQGLLFIKNLKPENAVVLADNGVSTDYLIPGITGKKTYTGHFLMTYESETKNQLVKSFYHDWSDANIAKKFLGENNIKYIVVTKYSFLDHRTVLMKKYPFLKLLFSNNSISVFTYKL